MFKRTKGYLLLTLLVLTGLAGNTHSNSLSGKERKVLVNHLKDSKTAFLKSVKNLSEDQLIRIAKVFNPDIDWVVIKSKEIWNGHDLVERGTNGQTWTVQVDFREDTGDQSRFRVYEDLNEYSTNSVEQQAIMCIVEE